MSYNFTDTNIQKQLTSEKTILENSFKNIMEDSTSILEGAYISYQVSDLNVDLGTGGTQDVTSPVENQFYHNTSTKENFRYSGGTWTQLDTSLLGLIVEAGFSSLWRKVDTLLRDSFLEIIIPNNYLPLNSENSQTLFIGFKNLMTSNDKITPAIGIPLVDSSERFYDREVNTVFRFPFKTKGNFIPLVEGSNKQLEDSLDYDRDKHRTIHYILSEYKSYSGSKSDGNSPDLNGTTLRF